MTMKRQWISALFKSGMITIASKQQSMQIWSRLAIWYTLYKRVKCNVELKCNFHSAPDGFQTYEPSEKKLLNSESKLAGPWSVIWVHVTRILIYYIKKPHPRQATSSRTCVGVVLPSMRVPNLSLSKDVKVRCVWGKSGWRTKGLQLTVKAWTSPSTVP